MRRLLIILTIPVILSACHRSRYIDLVSGEHVDLKKDGTTGLMVNNKTDKPVYLYVDTKTHDTIYGLTDEVINGHVVKTGDGQYKYDGDDDYKIKYGDYKMKVDGDEVKIKTGDKKIKIDDGERKVKRLDD
jgi:hypothetical protein